MSKHKSLKTHTLPPSKNISNSRIQKLGLQATQRQAQEAAAQRAAESAARVSRSLTPSRW